MIKELEKNLKSHNIKPTAMRLLVLEFLLGREAAIGLTELYKAFEKSDRTTLYRTLKVFEEYGMVHSIDDGTGVPKYALCEEGCNCEIERDLHPINYEPEEANLVVKGVCSDCKL